MLDFNRFYWLKKQKLLENDLIIHYMLFRISSGGTRGPKTHTASLGGLIITRQRSMHCHLSDYDIVAM